MIYLALISSAFYYFDLNHFVQSIFSERTLFSVKLSLLTASLSTLLALIIAIPAGYALSRYSFIGKNVIDVLLEIPIIISPAALGALIVIFFSQPFGNWFQENIGNVVFAFWGIIMAQFVTILGIATRMIKTTIDEIPKRYEDVARTLGASKYSSFKTITLPLAGRGILSAFILTWAKAFGEFGATFTVAGTMSFQTETVPTSVYMKLAGADIQGSMVMILILLSAGISLLALSRLFTRRLNYA